MKKNPELVLWLVLVILTCGAAIAAAQTPVTPRSSIAFDQGAPDLATAQSYRYITIVDGVRAAAAVPATCAEKVPAVAGVVECRIPFPATTPGDHTIALIATIDVNGTVLESPPSETVGARLYLAPITPANLRIQP